MSTMTRKSRPVKAARPAELAVSLCLAIDHATYRVEPIRADDPDVRRAYRLTKSADGAVYDVAATAHGLTCDCPDFTFRREGIDPAGCKHLRAAVRVGLVDAPAPARTDPAALAHVPDAFDEPAPVRAPAHCVCPQCRVCAGAIAAHSEAWNGVPLDPAEAGRRGAIESGHEPDPAEDGGDPATWPDWTDNWFWEPSAPTEIAPLDDQAEAARLFADRRGSCLLSEYLSPPTRQDVRRGLPSAGCAHGDGEHFAFGHRA